MVISINVADVGCELSALGLPMVPRNLKTVAEEGCPAVFSSRTCRPGL